STAFIVLLPEEAIPQLQAGDDASIAHFFPVHELLDNNKENTVELAFDHHQILNDGLERTANKLEYTTLAATFLPEPFTISDLRRVYEEVWNIELHAANFRRKIISADNVVIEAQTKGNSVFAGGKSAQLYYRGESELLMPPIMRKDI